MAVFEKLDKSSLPIMESITVLVPVYCHEKWLPTALQSIITQTGFAEISVLVGDDCSTDSSLEIAQRLAEQHRNIEVISNRKNLGILENYALLLERVKTKYVAILEGDDFWCSPEKIRRQFSYMEENPDVNGCFVEYFIYDEQTGTSHLSPAWSMGRYRKLQTLELLGNNPSASFSTCMYKTDKLRETLNLIKDYKAADWLTNILISKDSSFGFVPGPAAVYRLHARGSWTGLSGYEKKTWQCGSLQLAMKHLPASFAPYIQSRISSVFVEAS